MGIIVKNWIIEMCDAINENQLPVSGKYNLFVSGIGKFRRITPKW